MHVRLDKGIDSKIFIDKVGCIEHMLSFLREGFEKGSKLLRKHQLILFEDVDDALNFIHFTFD